ncbi:lectin like domain-containing protein [Arabiibacter massiliensis]|uniref:lectin like domain-containing protein n=1 Tax=Arabiibacter massiliensis TaxID=1870985 RepID=UPI0009BB5834|nr:lectin like domain-containing protein [Arabiibacter massiliensis]
MRETTRPRFASVQLPRILLAAALALALAPMAALAPAVVPAHADEPSPASRVVDQMLAANREALAEFEATGSMRALMGYDAYGSADGAAPLDNALLPSAYSLVDEGVVTPVKFQNPWGTCWAFGAIAASETSILSELKARGEAVDLSKFDLSERHLAWMSKTPLSDGSSQDGEGIHTFSDDPSIDPLDPSLVMNTGGTAFQATSVLCSGIGPVPEYLAPYQNDEGIKDADGRYYAEEGTWAVDQSLRFSQSFQLEESSILPPPENNRPEGVTAIKEELLAGRAVEISFCADTWRPGKPGTAKYLDTDTWAHYTWDDAGANHAVCVVGWDDAYSKDNFLADHQPSGDGAWLVKNSWGANNQEFPNKNEWGVDGNGYFWLSYYDKSLVCAETFDYYTVDPNPEAEYWIVAQYDFMPSRGALRMPQTEPTSMANVFTAEERMNLTAVSCETVAPGSQVAFDVYLLDDGCANPADGRLAAHFEKTYRYGGYHREKLESPIVVEAGKAYSVVITVQAEDGYDLLTRMGVNRDGVDFVNQSQPEGRLLSCYEEGVINPGESLLCFGGGWGDWAEVVESLHQEAAEMGEDFLTYDNFGIKAYGDPAPAPVEGVTQVAVVQGTLPIGDEASYDASLMSSGYTKAAAARALSDVAAEGAAGDPALVCGTPFMEPLPEGLSSDSANALALDGEDGGQSKTIYQVGDVRTFFATGREAEGFKARVVATGGTYTIWEEEGYDLFAPADLETFAAELDAAIKKVYATFGDAARYDVDGDGKVAFVFHRFGESMDYAAGYFSSVDLFSKEDLEPIEPELAGFTNHMDMLHLNTVNARAEEGGLYFDKDRVMYTLVHELQHLVNYAQTGGHQDTWLNEVFSEAAVAVAGYGATVNSRLDFLHTLLHFGVGVPFVFEGEYAPNDVYGSAYYAHWYLFSRYLANQTRGLSSGDGRLHGGDGLYRSVFDLERDDRGFGSCTKEALVKTLEALGYLGEGAGCAAKDFDELLLNYNTALLVRDKEGPCSLTNDPSADPSVIDGAQISLLSVVEGFVPEAVYGGGAAVYVELDRAQPTAGAGEGVQERIVDSPLPLDYAIEASPAEGSALRDGDPISLDSPQLDMVDGSRLEYCAMSYETYEANRRGEWVYQEYDGPIAFDPDAPVIAARFACDRGASAHSLFIYEVDASQPEEPDPAEPEKPEAPGKPDAPPPATDGPPAAGGGDVSEAAALAPTGDALAGAPAALAALAFAAAAAAAAARRRRALNKPPARA